MSISRLDEGEEARRLVERVPDADLTALVHILRRLATCEDPVLAAFESAHEDDEGKLSEETSAAIAESRRAAEEGNLVSHEEVLRQLGP